MQIPPFVSLCKYSLISFWSHERTHSISVPFFIFYLAFHTFKCIRKSVLKHVGTKQLYDMTIIIFQVLEVLINTSKKSKTYLAEVKMPMNKSMQLHYIPVTGFFHRPIYF